MRLIITIILVVAAVIIFVFPTRGLLDVARPMEEERAQLEEALGNAKQIRAERDKLQERYNSFRTEDINKLHKLLPSHVDSVRLILDINTIEMKNLNPADKAKTKKNGLHENEVTWLSKNPPRIEPKKVPRPAKILV